MLKRLAVVSLFGILLLGRLGVAGGQLGKPLEKRDRPTQTQQPVPPTHVIIDPSSATVHIRSEADDSKKTPEERPLPRFTRPEWVIVYITAIYVFISAWTLIAVNKQANIANRALIAQFRPRIIVRAITLDPPTSAIYDGLDDKAWKIELHLKNSGGTVAHIQECVASFFLESTAPNPPPSENWTHKWGELSLAPGERSQLDLVFSSQDLRAALHVMEYVVRHREDQYTWPICTGTIVYSDANGLKRETGFFRKWEVDGQRFTPSGDPEKEYAD
jgi:hypothetical protein